MKEFYWSDEIKPNSAILVVDLEEQYLSTKDISERLSVYYDGEVDENDEEVVFIQKQMINRFNELITNFEDLGGKYPIYTTFQTNEFPSLTPLKVSNIGYWASDDELKRNNAIKHLSQYESVAVCGIWREQCVAGVVEKFTELFSEYETTFYLLDNPNYTISTREINDRKDGTIIRKPKTKMVKI